MMLKLFRMELDELSMSSVSIRHEIQGVLDEISHLRARRQSAEEVISSLRSEIESSRGTIRDLQSKLHITGSSHSSLAKRRR